MNLERHLIIIKGKDRTDAIRYCNYIGGKYEITFNDGKTYKYAYSSVQWYREPNILLPEDVIVYHNRISLSRINQIFVFREWVRICFSSGYQRVYPRRELTFEKNSLSNLETRHVFDYLKHLAEIVSVKDEQDKSFLSKQYQKITTISPESVLSMYLNPALWKSSNPLTAMPYSPFGFNLSQREATEKALTETISMIEGPPGTGKTQTILNIIANAVMQKRTVAVVSNNNAATANVLEKLQKQGLGFIAAFLGNANNREKFFAEQSGTYPDMSSWILQEQSLRELESELQEDGNKLQEMLRVKNEEARLKQELEELALEKKYFDQYYYQDEIIGYRSVYHHNSETILSLWQEIQKTAEKYPHTPFKNKLVNLFRYGIFSFSFYEHSFDKLIMFLQRAFYIQKGKELQHQIDDCKRRLEHYHFAESMKKYSEHSMKLFKAKLAKKYAQLKKRKLYTSAALWLDSEFKPFLHDYPVILSTTHSLRSCMKENYLFNYVIMDEASQIDIVTGALALSCGKQAVIVGDLQQLPHVVTKETANATNLIFDKFSIRGAYRYAENSMLSSTAKLFEHAPRTLLNMDSECG